MKAHSLQKIFTFIINGAKASNTFWIYAEILYNIKNHDILQYPDDV